MQLSDEEVHEPTDQMGQREQPLDRIVQKNIVSLTAGIMILCESPRTGTAAQTVTYGDGIATLTGVVRVRRDHQTVMVATILHVFKTRARNYFPAVSA